MWRSLFKKKQGLGRIAMEETQTIPITYRTPQAGTRPIDYEFSRNMKKILNQMEQDIDKLINEGGIDYYTDLNIFDGLIDSYYQMLINDVERQGLKHKMAVHSIVGEVQIALREYREIKTVGSELLPNKEVFKQAGEEKEYENIR